MSIGDALAHLDAAIAALTYDEAVQIDCATRVESDVPTIERCIAQDLQQLERFLQPKGSRPTLIGALAESITQAFVEVTAARDALKGGAK